MLLAALRAMPGHRMLSRLNLVEELSAFILHSSMKGRRKGRVNSTVGNAVVHEVKAVVNKRVRVLGLSVKKVL